MSFPRACLTLLMALGLLLAPGTTRVAAGGDGCVPTWRDARHDSPVLVADARAEGHVARPADEESPSAEGDGGSVLPPPARPWSLPEAVVCRTQVEPSRDGRACLAQPHRRVNGSADAHGARA